MPRISEVGGVEGFAGVYLHSPNLFKGFMCTTGCCGPTAISTLDERTKLALDQAHQERKTST